MAEDRTVTRHYCGSNGQYCKYEVIQKIGTYCSKYNINLRLSSKVTSLRCKQCRDEPIKENHG